MLTREKVKGLAEAVAELATEESGFPEMLVEVTEDDDSFAIRFTVNYLEYRAQRHMDWAIQVSKRYLGEFRYGEDAKVFYGVAIALGGLKQEMLACQRSR